MVLRVIGYMAAAAGFFDAADAMLQFRSAGLDPGPREAFSIACKGLK